MVDKKAQQFWSRYKRLVSKDLPVLIKTNIPQSTLSTWKNKNIFPRTDEALKIAEAIHPTVEYLVTGKSTVNASFSPAVLEIAAFADQLNEEGFKILKDMVSNIFHTYPKKYDRNAR